MAKKIQYSICPKCGKQEVSEALGVLKCNNCDYRLDMFEEALKKENALRMARMQAKWNAN
jgi:ribosomal protein L37AE/L43A